MDPTARFSGRVENYVSYRPGYPAGVLHILREETGLTPLSRVADIGSGTGLSSELFLGNGNTVFGVEPNADMREAADRLLAHFPAFRSVPGTAASTTLPAGSIDHVIAAQSFHWFDPPLARKEFARILRPGGWVVLLWNRRRVETTPFLRAYEALLQCFGTDYRAVQERHPVLATLSAFFAGGEFCRRTLYNEQRFDLQGLEGRLLSSSYTPTANHESYRRMLRDLKRIFNEHARDGQVLFEYDLELYFGHVANDAAH
jgi:SAM-dependent methyltransferase